MSEYPDAKIPQELFDDAEREARWRARFSAPRVSLPDWAREAPGRSLYVSNASGTWELYAWDRESGAHRQVTDRPNGTFHGTLSADGARVWWFDDTDGDEFGSWVSEDFAAGGGKPEPALPGTHPGYPAGLELGPTVTGVGMSTDDGVTVWVSRAGGAPEVVYEHEQDGGLSALSWDESLLVLSHSEHGDSRHPALRVLRVDGAATVADKWDGPGKGLDALDFAPVAGDPRLLVLHERHGREELLIWDVLADTEREIDLGLPGEVSADWYPDGTALLIAHTHHARTTMHRYDLETGELVELATPAGTVGGASVRPDRSVEYSWSSAATPSLVRTLRADGTDEVLLTPPGERPPGSEPVRDVFVPVPHGPNESVHALVSRPEGAGDGPVPTVFNLHGGPHAADEDRFSAYRAAWLDAGFAVVEINYRGSTGYGSAWRDAIEGRPGLTELADVAHVHDWAVRDGLTTPELSVVAGASWGGYLTLLALGTQPERWAGGVAGVPVADYVSAYADEMEPLRAYDRALFGGSPEEVPAVYEECSPLTYVDEVRAPVLVLAGDNDPRCPIQQILNYLDRLAQREVPFEFYRYDAGHGSLVVAETLRQVAAEIHFARRAVGRA
ncbi:MULTISPECIES: prolyl oligopeptidase family serine peptidase [unclassified Saccharopolyspora]|uniref:S9 family peptidase n=1 Tax=unclassified Saccharopolyspora TaxID=2646250 RepID=UPI001CD471BE|nr:MULTISPECIES: prolyl oligopeptidase family serine peptidase [unclassified Saccharopolyspora]MCA1186558.1 prolyl oligopeptidase family serine peptidase [Saccharopolyspora sp. 6T]MCA1192023.1 prolyl oligopeptidase family serine peptidase [Saccharopolyspora sp. 6V]MCA1226183.1 prolyl oligopeptidase family serine peptidase [Saccharopolyspora sp. 6M]MCA1281431.1 prolyl oligopeptidase family serine peptidase [Saccharopolyspora sp. 7B]